MRFQFIFLKKKRDIVVKANKNYIKLLSDELNQKEEDNTMILAVDIKNKKYYRRL